MSYVVNKTNPENGVLRSVNTPDYPIANWWVNPTLPQCDCRYWKNDAGTLAEMSSAEKDAAYLVIDKQAKTTEIAQRTEELIAAGFTFSDEDFRMSELDRLRLAEYYLVRSTLTYPLTLTSSDGLATVMVYNSTALEAVFDIVTTVTREYNDSGDVLMAQVRSATTLAEVAAVVDTR